MIGPLRDGLRLSYGPMSVTGGMLLNLPLTLLLAVSPRQADHKKMIEEEALLASRISGTEISRSVNGLDEAARLGFSNVALAEPNISSFDSPHFWLAASRVAGTWTNSTRKRRAGQKHRPRSIRTASVVPSIKSVPRPPCTWISTKPGAIYRPCTTAVSAGGSVPTSTINRD